MSYELITPERAGEILAKNFVNRSLSKGTVLAYASDIKTEDWDEKTGNAISIDEDGILRDGQHRLSAVLETNRPIKTWVCYGVSKDGIYDNNRKRSTSDQIAITRPDIEKTYKQTRVISIIKSLITRGNHDSRRVVTSREIIHFIERHKDDLDGFFLNFPQTSVTRISIATVQLSLFIAYMNGVSMDSIKEFYEILCSGMSIKPESFPVIAYRNYLKDQTFITSTNEEIARCQYALKKFLTKSCTKRSMSPKKLIWDFPYQNQ